MAGAGRSSRALVDRSVSGEAGADRDCGWMHSFDIYRAQAEVFGGRSDGKFGGPSAEISLFQVLISAGDN